MEKNLIENEEILDLEELELDEEDVLVRGLKVLV